MTATISRRYAFGEQVFDATLEEHDMALGRSQVRVVIADYLTEVISVEIFETESLARQWIATQPVDPNIVHHTVGADVK